MDIQVDPNLVNQAYQQMLNETQTRLQGQLVLLQAAATQLQGQVESLTKENEELRSKNTELMQASGRQDGVPQEVSADDLVPETASA